MTNKRTHMPWGGWGRKPPGYPIQPQIYFAGVKAFVVPSLCYTPLTVDLSLRYFPPDNDKIGGLAFLFDFNTHKGREEPDISESHLCKQILELLISVSLIGQRVASHFVGFSINDKKPLRCRLAVGIPETLGQAQMWVV